MAGRCAGLRKSHPRRSRQARRPTNGSRFRQCRVEASDRIELRRWRRPIVDPVCARLRAGAFNALPLHHRQDQERGDDDQTHRDSPPGAARRAPLNHADEHAQSRQAHPSLPPHGRPPIDSDHEATRRERLIDEPRLLADHLRAPRKCRISIAAARDARVILRLNSVGTL